MSTINLNFQNPSLEVNCQPIRRFHFKQKEVANIGPKVKSVEISRESIDSMHREIARGMFWMAALGCLVFAAMVAGLAAIAIFFGPLPLVMMMGGGLIIAAIIDVIERREKAQPLN